MKKELSFGLLALILMSFLGSVSAYSVNASTSVVFSSGNIENFNNNLQSDDVSSWKTDFAWVFAICFIIVLIIWWIYSVNKKKNSKISSSKVSGAKKKRKR